MTIALLLASLLSAAAIAEEPPPQQEEEEPVVRVIRDPDSLLADPDDPMIGQKVIVHLPQGEPLSGVLLSRDENGEIAVFLSGAGKTIFELGEYVSVDWKNPPDDYVDELTGEEVVVVQHYGSDLTGLLISKDRYGAMVLEQSNGVRRSFEPGSYRSVRSIHEDPFDGDIEEMLEELEELETAPRSAAKKEDESDRSQWPEDPGASRYFHGLSALSLEEGVVSASQKQLLITEVAYGATDQWDVQLSACVYCWGVSPVAADVATSFSVEVRERMHVAVRGRGLASYYNLLTGDEEALFAGVLAGAVTWGDDRTNLSVALGAGRDYARDLGIPIFASLSGAIRVKESVALMSENWLIIAPEIYTGESMLFIQMVGARFLGETLVADAGVCSLPRDFEGEYTRRLVPWLGVTYHFFGVYRVPISNPNPIR